MSNMNINNKPIQQRIEELQKKSQPTEGVSKQPVETGIDRSTFEQRKAVFEQQSKTQPKPENVLSESLESDLSASIDQLKPEGLQQRTEKLKEHQPDQLLSQNQEQPSHYEQLRNNQHDIKNRVDTNVPGIQGGFEFNLGSNFAQNTAMFVSKESQDENLLHFKADKGVTRGSSDQGLSTQTDSKGLWAGSKANRMLFVMSPEGKIYAIDPSRPIEHKGATVLDVRIHHSSLLNGEKVAGAGEIQVNAGLTAQELEDLQNRVLKKVQDQLSQKSLNSESAQNLISKLVDQELSRILKNHQPGQIEVISDRSGHYRPDLKMTAQVLAELEKNAVDIEKVSVELGDKSGLRNVPEGELRVPSRTIQAMQDQNDAENFLRNVNARKQNVHQELLSKVKRVGSDTGNDQQKAKEELNAMRIEQHKQLDKLESDHQKQYEYLQHLYEGKQFDKAAAIYERLALSKGVNWDSESLLRSPTVQKHQQSDLQKEIKRKNMLNTLRVDKKQEESVVQMIQNDHTLTRDERELLLNAYIKLINSRSSATDNPSVEVEKGYYAYDSDDQNQSLPPKSGNSNYFNDKGQRITSSTHQVIQEPSNQPNPLRNLNEEDSTENSMNDLINKTGYQDKNGHKLDNSGYSDNNSGYTLDNDGYSTKQGYTTHNQRDNLDNESDGGKKGYTDNSAGYTLDNNGYSAKNGYTTYNQRDNLDTDGDSDQKGYTDNSNGYTFDNDGYGYKNGYAQHDLTPKKDK